MLASALFTRNLMCFQVKHKRKAYLKMPHLPPPPLVLKMIRMNLNLKNFTIY